ncbi:hypothetical protein [Spirosoma radiotolerans]|uniref:Uncharacterized protein n=1 Tax=Spirosoma radiotolerans TaxID=1379870 RepID=A0A0E3ZVZ1_9BACT|nr:hypothetical protein [Spirosoma radiotolerans]AKD56078.1 hypothetical protein SD10_15420 [Spirosoma radiotolerans]
MTWKQKSVQKQAEPQNAKSGTNGKKIDPPKKKGFVPHVKVLPNAGLSSVPEDWEKGSSPILIEVLITEKAKAKSLIQSLVDANKISTVKRALAIGLNGKGKDADKTLTADCKELVELMKKNGLPGFCIAFSWAPISTDPEMKGYVFPFKEARSLLTTDALAQKFHSELESKTGQVIVRTMDQDVSNDPLLTTSEDNFFENELIPHLLLNPKALFTGGYDWDTNSEHITARLSEKKKNVIYADKIAEAIAIINTKEHEVREALMAEHSKSVYMPEPNTYMNLHHRRAVTPENLNNNQLVDEVSQQNEGTVFAKMGKVSRHENQIKTTKPIKQHLDNLISAFADILAKPNQGSRSTEIEKIIKEAHQSHLSENVTDRNIKKQMSEVDKNFYVQDELDKINRIVKHYRDECVSDIVKCFEQV